MRFLVFLLFIAAPASAQPLLFGSADDPTEAAPRDFRAAEMRLSAVGGPTYLDTQWRTGLGVEIEATAGPLSAQIGGRLHVGVGGLYEPEADEWYDLVRTIRYVRLDPSPRLPVYARIGPLRGVTLGTGHLARSYQTTSAWDERTVGAEAAVRIPSFEAAVFTSDVRMNGLVGGRVGATPFTRGRTAGLRSVEIGASVLGDLSLRDSLATTALGLDARLDLLHLGDFALSSYVSWATFLEYGSGFGAGTEFGGRDLGGFGRLVARVGLWFSSDEFIPGYFNAFYPLSNPTSGIWNADAFYRDATDQTAGTLLRNADGGTALELSLRAVIYGGFELGTYFRRSYTDARLSEGGLRVSITPGRGDRFRFLFDVQRQGRTAPWNLVGGFRDQNVLLFQIDYALVGPAVLFIRSRYGYRRVDDAPNGDARYLVERRFEPLIGLRAVLR